MYMFSPEYVMGAGAVSTEPIGLAMKKTTNKEREGSSSDSGIGCHLFLVF